MHHTNGLFTPTSKIFNFTPYTVGLLVGVLMLVLLLPANKICIDLSRVTIMTIPGPNEFGEWTVGPRKLHDCKRYKLTRMWYFEIQKSEECVTLLRTRREIRGACNLNLIWPRM